MRVTGLSEESVEGVKVVSQKRIRPHTADGCVSQIQGQIVQVTNVLQEERVSERFVGETVDVPAHVPMNMGAGEECTRVDPGQSALEQQANVSCVQTSGAAGIVERACVVTERTRWDTCTRSRMHERDDGRLGASVRNHETVGSRRRKR